MLFFRFCVALLLLVYYEKHPQFFFLRRGCARYMELLKQPPYNLEKGEHGAPVT